MQKTIFRILVFGLVVIPFFSHAATISISGNPQTVGVGKTVAITVAIDSSAPVNTFSGTLQYPAALLEPLGISDGNSIISLWVQHPTTTASTITYAGVTPGGFSGSGGILFTALFKAKETGSATIVLADTSVLRNDGKGTPEETTAKPLTISIQNQGEGFSEHSDTMPPEAFKASLGHNADLFGGRWYLAFTASDKGVGIDHYEIVESRFTFMPQKWHGAQSPYELADQYLTSSVLIRAIDRAGNIRESVFPRQHLLRPYEMFILGGIILILILWWFLRRRRAL